MATDSKRLQALQGAVTLLQAADGTGAFWNDLSESRQVTTMLQPKSTQFNQPYNAWVWVHDGAQQFAANSATALTYETQLEILLEVLVRDSSADDIVEELNKAIQDVVWAVGLDHTLSGTVADAFVASIDEPAYSDGDKSGSATVRVTATIDIEQGVSI